MEPHHARNPTSFPCSNHEAISAGHCPRLACGAAEYRGVSEADRLHLSIAAPLGRAEALVRGSILH